MEPRLNYKRRVYSTYTKGTPEVSILGDRGGCATGPCRTPTTLDHTTNTESKQLYQIHRNKHREVPKWGEKGTQSK